MNSLYLRLYLIVTLSVMALASVATNALANEPEDVIEIFMTEVMASDVGAAIDKTMPEEGLAMAGAKMDLVKSQISGALAIYGVPSGYDIFEEEELTPRLIRISFITYHRVVPVKWTFHLYESDGEWGLVRIDFTDQVQNY